MLNAKFRKLIKDPNLFFSDMVKNKKRKMNSVYVKKEEGHYQYTIVSAVYNVGRYLDDFFKSIASQKLDFKKHIFIIMVDDGSQDNSAEIIQKWKSKYPDNIKYIWQENAGQSIARNTGLEHVETEWVTFIDPDDYLNLEYFSSIDKYLYDNVDKTANLISCNIVMYLESKKIYRDNHPLNYKFSKGNNLVPISNADNEIQLSASSAFFRTSIIKNDEIFFDSRVKPNFEDAHFISKYLLNIEDGYILFMKDAEYIYRKREDGTSTLDTSWSKPERFTNVPEFGYLDTLKMYRNTYGSVPVNIQKTILYEALWYIKHLDNRPERTHFLSDSEKNFFIEKMKEIFSYIDNETIMKFNLAGIWFYHKMAMMSFFKNTMPGFQIAYVDRYDAAKELIRVRYFSNKSYYEQFLVDGEDSIPVYAKTTSHEFVGENLIEERWVWISIHQAKKIEIKLDNVTTSISFGGKQHKGPVPISAIVESLQKQLPKFPGRRKYENSWVLMDRDMQADDNAEHLYRFIRDHHPEQKIFFALRKESHDWERLRDDGFNLIDFDSSEHRLALGVCKKVISSHANYYVTNLLGPKMLLGRHFVFLQHGVTKDDISCWLNTKDGIDCFITASPHEYKSICEDNSKYNFSNKEVFLTGFPRHDNLINGSNLKEKLIIIMPTWRSSIVGPVLGDGDSRGINPSFMDSTFANHWKNLLHSNEFKELLERSGYKAAFFPHVNIKPYLELFDIPEYIDVITHTDGSIQELFIKASIMITDYSSVAFEMAIQNKQTIYYQFDEEEFFSGHNYIKGYFDYRRNGFGPVVTTQESLINELSRSLSNNCVADAEILYRINDMFPVRDNQNCARTFEAIKSLDDGSLNREIELCNLKKSALKATEHLKWKDAEIRWNKYIDATIDIISNAERFESIDYYFQSLSEQGKHSYLDSIIDSYLPDARESLYILEKYASLMSLIGLWHSAEVRWERYLDICTEVNSCAVFNYLESIRKQGRLLEVEQMIDGLLINNSDQYLQQSVREAKALLLMSRHMWNEAINEWTSIGKNNVDNLKYCECLAYDFQYLELDYFLENEMSDFISPSIINAFSLYAHQDWEGVIKILSGEEFDLQDDESLAARLLLMKSHAYRYIDDEENAHKCLVRYESSVKNDPQCRYEIASLAFKNEKWSKVIAQISKACTDLVMLPKEFKLIYLNSLLSLNSYEKVEDVFTALSSDCLFDIDIILLRVKNLILTDRWQEAFEVLLLLEQDTQEDVINQYLSELTECEKHSKVDDIIKSYLDVNKQISSVFIEGLALSASSLMIWSSAEYRWSVYLELFDGENCLAVFNYLEAIRKQKRYIDLDNKIRELSITHDTSLQKCILEMQALLYMSKHMWSEAINSWRILGKDNVDNIKYCECLSYYYCCDELDYFIKAQTTADLNIKVFAAYARKKWDEIITLLNLDSDELQNERNIMSRMLLIKSAAYRNLGEFDFAYKCLFLYEEKVKDDAQCRFEIARVAFAAKQWRKVITQLDKASPELSSLPMEFKGIYLQSLFSLRLFSKMEAIFEIFSDDLLSDELMMKLKADMYMSLGKWNNALSILNLLDNEDPEIVYAKSLSLKNLGDFECAFGVLTKFKPIDTTAAWNLRLELAQLNDNWEDAYKCSLRVKWKKDGMINITSDNIEHLVMLKS